MSEENNGNENGGNQNPFQIGGVDIDVQGIVEQLTPQFELPELSPITFEQPELKLNLEELNAQSQKFTDALLSQGTFKRSPIMERIITETQRKVDQKYEINPDIIKTDYDYKNEGDPKANDGKGNVFQFNK